MKKIPRKSIVQRNTPKYVAACLNCGTLLTEETVKKTNDKNYCGNCIPKVQFASVVKSVYFYAPEGLIKYIAYIISFFSPIAGFIIGLIYFSQKDELAKKFGKNCLIIMGIGLVVLLILIIISVVLTLLAGGEGGFNIGEGYY